MTEDKQRSWKAGGIFSRCIRTVERKHEETRVSHHYEVLVYDESTVIFKAVIDLTKTETDFIYSLLFAALLLKL